MCGTVYYSINKAVHRKKRVYILVVSVIKEGKQLINGNLHLQ